MEMHATGLPKECVRLLLKCAEVSKKLAFMLQLLQNTHAWVMPSGTPLEVPCKRGAGP